MIGRAGGPFTPMRSRESCCKCVLVNVEHVDEHFGRALSRRKYPAAARGHALRRPPLTASDLEGHWWTFSQNIADVDPSAWGAVLKP
jgi:hypothetical protein